MKNNNPIISNTKNPTLTAIGSEKIHGTNLTVAYNEVDGIYYQSRNNIITLDKDNAGSAFFAYSRKDTLISIIKSLAKEHSIDLKENTIVLCGEFAGTGVQKKSALEGLSKRFILFQHFKVTPIGDDEHSYWLETKVGESWVDSKEDLIFNIMNFPTYKLEIDFENPRLYINKMNELMQKVEENSPVGQFFGIEGNIGEGIVFTVEYNNLVFKWKVKGEKHSNSKVTKLPKVDDAKEQLKIDIATKVTPAWRLEQMFDLANDTINGGVPDIKNISSFIKMVILDVIKEEIDLLVGNGLEIKNIQGIVSRICKNWYLEQLSKI